MYTGCNLKTTELFWLQSEDYRIVWLCNGVCAVIRLNMVHTIIQDSSRDGRSPDFFSLTSPWKDMLWEFINSAQPGSSNYPQRFSGEIRNIKYYWLKNTPYLEFWVQLFKTYVIS